MSDKTFNYLILIGVSGLSWALSIYFIARLFRSILHGLPL